mmetsp:Transcript_136493/g.265505  ORF Transcript_136493/g.265505 Transcript_136493/m.265505 type:complete len:629 (-) Transcript_136493:314-2200(-)
MEGTVQTEDVTGIDSDPSASRKVQSTFSATVDCRLFEALSACLQQQLRGNLQQGLQQQMQQLLDQSFIAVDTVLQDSFQLFHEQLHQARVSELDARRTRDISTGSGVPPFAGLLNGTAVSALEAAMEAMDTVEEATTTAIPPPESSKESEFTATFSSERKSQKRMKSVSSMHIRTSMAKLFEENGANKRSPFQEKLGQVMQGTLAHSFLAICVILNSLTVFLKLQLLGEVADKSLGFHTIHGNWQLRMDLLRVAECVFGLVFLVELLLNIYAFRWRYFLYFFNVADTIIVLLSLLEILVLEPIDVSLRNISFVRTLRLAKIFKGLRIVRVLTFFHGLRVLVATAIHSLASLFWSLVVMAILMLLGTTFLCLMLHDFVIDEGADLATRIWVNHMFGSGDRALYTVFEMTFSGCWPNFASRVVKEVNALYAAFFAVYVSFVIFGMTRIISALFLRETMNQVARDHDIMTAQRATKKRRLKNDLAALFDEADTSGDGALSLEELTDLCSHPKVQYWFSDLGIDTSDATTLFELLDDGDGAVTQQEFVDGVTRIKGEARAQDLVPLISNVHKILGHCKYVREICETMASSTSSPGTPGASMHAMPLTCPSMLPSPLLPALSKSQGGVPVWSK